MREWIFKIMETYGYGGIFLLIFIENIFPPIPSEVILTFGGFMTTRTDLQVPIVIVMATAGSVVGAMLLYVLGRVFNEEKLIQFARNYPILHMKPENIEKAMVCYRKFAYKTVFFCRMIPIVRSLISIPAGVGKMPLFPFLGLTTIGSAIWNTILICAGEALGEAWESILSYLDTYANFVFFVIMVGGIALTIYNIKNKKK